LKTYLVNISRYNPTRDDQPTIKKYSVPRLEQGTVLEALQYIYEELDSTLLFSYGCRYQLCGKCTIKINGKPGLACDTILEDGMLLEPLDNFPVIRDLAVDRSGLLTPSKELKISRSLSGEVEVVHQSPKFFDFVNCTECLSCLSVCPVFAIKEEGYGPLFRVQLAEMFYDDRDSKDRYDALTTFYACTTCDRCSTVCPQQISLDEAMGEIRNTLFSENHTPETMIGVRNSIVSKGNVFASPQSERIDIYPRAVKEKIASGTLGKKSETLLFMGCVSSYLDMKIVPSFLKIIEAARVNYTTLGENEICCGYPLYLMGSPDFKSNAKALIKRMKATGAHQLVTPCAGCYKTFRKLYPQIGDLGMDIYLSVHYIEELVKQNKISFTQKFNKKITYHDPCDIGRTFGIYEEPRNIISRIPGITFVEMKYNRDQARCCGGGGNVQIYDPELAVKMASERVRDALAVGAEIIVSACPACKDNLRKGASAIPKEERGKIKVMDIAEVVAQAIKS